MSGNAISFTGASTAKIDIAASSSLNNVLPFSVFAWVLRTTTRLSGAIYAKGSFGAQNRQVLALRGNDGATPTSTVDMSVTDASATGDNTLDILPLSQWVLTGMSVDGVAGLQMWKGNLGTRMTECSYSATPPTPSGTQNDNSASAVRIGNDLSGTLAFPGYIAFVAAFSKKLTLPQMEECRQLTIETLNPRELRVFFKQLGCVLLMPLNSCAGATILDYSGYSNHGTPSSDVQMQWGMPNRRI